MSKTTKYENLSMGGDLTYMLKAGTPYAFSTPTVPYLSRIVSNDDTLTIVSMEDDEGRNLLALMNMTSADTIGKGMVLNPGYKIKRVEIGAGSAFGIVLT